MSGPAENLDEGRLLLRESASVAPDGLEIDPLEDVGRYLGRRHKVYDQWMSWQGENPTDPDLPPPKTAKDVPLAAPAELAQAGRPGLDETRRQDAPGARYLETGGPSGKKLSGASPGMRAPARSSRRSKLQRARTNQAL